eukprot:m.21791 g.21791  ORF g.21791 m.21791 type:complete len:395 (+) comp28221_c0_seq1:46-1230(+)
MEHLISQTIESQKGVVFSRPAIVHRKMYAGRDILAPNSRFDSDLVDSRGYLPVEWWIMSKTPAENPIPKPNEGITHLKLVNGEEIPLPDAISVAEHALLGDHASKWPLPKVLDIGGRPVASSFNTAQEIPPIPCHVHAGVVCDGHCKGPGKLEAYFFPPLDVVPYNLKSMEKVVTRIGIKEGVKKEDFLVAMKQFGKDDSLYDMLRSYEVKPMETWMVRRKVVHAPGPWLTLEMQTPQDDFNMLAWRLGEVLSKEGMADLKENVQLKGLGSEEALLDETVDWAVNTDPEYEAKWRQTCEVLESGPWGRKIQLFYNEFYGEGLIVNAGAKWVGSGDGRPRAGIVWSGFGKVNGMSVSHEGWDAREFLLVPGYDLEVENVSSDVTLMLLIIFPIAE